MVLGGQLHVLADLLLVPTEQEAGRAPSQSEQFGEEKFSCNSRNCTMDGHPACSLVTIPAELSELHSEMQ